MTNARANLSRRALLASSCLSLALAPVAALAAGEPVGQPRRLRVGGTGTALAAIRVVADAFVVKRPGVSIDVVPSLGSSGGIKALLAGAIDLALSGRPLKDEERAKGIVARGFAMSPLGFATRVDTKTDEITLAQIADIYADRVGAWPDGSAMRLVLRPESDVDTVILRRMSPAVSSALDGAFVRSGLIMAASDQENLDILERIPGSLGIATLGQILAERRSLKLLKLDGVAPTLEALSRGSYRHGKTLYLALRPEPTSLAAEFASFLASPEGQAALAGIGGFVALDGATL
jgi:phosphate transport system substrate-binding protein